MNLRFGVPIVLVFSAAVLAQDRVPDVLMFQVKYASNLNIGDSVFNISNNGATGGDLCVSVYTFSPDEQEISCCSCTVTPNALVSLSARNDLISHALTPAVPTSIVVKLVATISTTCSAATLGTPVNSGLLAWGTTLHALPPPPASPAAGLFGVTETPFTPAILSATEYARITSLCGFIQSNGSGFGTCKTCRLGGQGALKQ